MPKYWVGVNVRIVLGGMLKIDAADPETAKDGARRLLAEMSAAGEAARQELADDICLQLQDDPSEIVVADDFLNYGELIIDQEVELVPPGLDTDES